MKQTLAMVLMLLAGSAGAAEKKSVVGVFLPSSVNNGQERLNFAESISAGLSKALGHPVVGRNFGRYEDFAKAVADGSLEMAIVEAWVAAESTANFVPIASASIGGQAQQRWGLLARSKTSVRALSGKRLAMTKAVSAQDWKFLNNVIFVGDLNAQKYFKLVSVPSVESALKAVEVKGAEVALVPLSSVTKESPVIYRSPRIPGAVVISFRGDREEQQRAVVGLGAVLPVDHFAPLKGNEVSDLRALVLKGPPKRLPQLAESPTLRLDVTPLINLAQIGMVLPSFVEGIDASNEKPDD